MVFCLTVYWEIYTPQDEAITVLQNIRNYPPIHKGHIPADLNLNKHCCDNSNLTLNLPFQQMAVQMNSLWRCSFEVLHHKADMCLAFHYHWLLDQLVECNASLTVNTCNVILDNDQLDTLLLYFTIHLLYSSTCFEHHMLIIRRLNCIDAASGIVTLSKWPSGAQFERELSQPVHQTTTYWEWRYQMLHQYNSTSWWWAYDAGNM